VSNRVGACCFSRWLVISLEVPHSDAGWSDLLPGSLFYAIGFIGVQLFNVLMLGNLIQSKTTTYGAHGTAATLLLAFFLLGRVMVGAAVLNATPARAPLPLGGAASVAPPQTCPSVPE
jgi:uncharacterized BrkB/YihY/UPF0761 family membrane protein